MNNEVRLGEYVAVVAKNEVTVGCQVIPIEKVREILEIAEKL